MWEMKEGKLCLIHEMLHLLYGNDVFIVDQQPEPRQWRLLHGLFLLSTPTEVTPFLNVGYCSLVEHNNDKWK